MGRFDINIHDVSFFKLYWFVLQYEVHCLLDVYNIKNTADNIFQKLVTFKF